MKYIGVNLVKAETMTLAEYNNLRGWIIPADEDAEKKGYKIVYPCGHITWSPNEVFEKSHMQLLDPDGTKILQGDCDNFVAGILDYKHGEKTTIVHAILRNEFEIFETSSCVDENNYDRDIGRYIGEGKKSIPWSSQNKQKCKKCGYVICKCEKNKKG